MNERAKQLALQALKYPDNDNDGLTVFDNDELEKFAELIVQRTLDIVEAHTEIFQSSEARAMVEHIKQSVKTDFGIKGED
jgi:hypothetical protein